MDGPDLALLKLNNPVGCFTLNSPPVMVDASKVPTVLGKTSALSWDS
jgi:hypothetical protein